MAFKDELIINKYIWGIMAKFELHNCKNHHCQKKQEAPFYESDKYQN